MNFYDPYKDIKEIHKQGRAAKKKDSKTKRNPYGKSEKANHYAWESGWYFDSDSDKCNGFWCLATTAHDKQKTKEKKRLMQIASTHSKGKTETKKLEDCQKANAAMRKHGNNKSRAADSLGISDRTLGRWLDYKSKPSPFPP